jgi:hypothetical protein
VGVHAQLMEISYNWEFPWRWRETFRRFGGGGAGGGDVAQPFDGDENEHKKK